jgi:hypothetical protein
MRRGEDKAVSVDASSAADGRRHFVMQEQRDLPEIRHH